jgi:hypothetical protein
MLISKESTTTTHTYFERPKQIRSGMAIQCPKNGFAKHMLLITGK